MQKGIKVKWTINARSEDITGCNNPFVIPALFGDKNIRLKEGDNLVEFTAPDKAGDISYSCWMGMIPGNIKVVDDIAKVTENETKNTQTASNSKTNGCCTSGAGNCCGGIAAGGNFSGF